MFFFRPVDIDSVREDVSGLFSHAAGAREDVAHLVVRRSSRFLRESDKNAVAMAFARLLPYGVGGPCDDRPVRISMEEWVRHKLRLADRSFAQDPDFTLVMFDIITRKMGVGRIAFSVRLMAEAKLAEILSVTLAQFRAHAVHTGLVREALFSGQQPPSLPPGLGGAQKLIQEVRAVSRHIVGTNEERLVWQRRAFCMAGMLGQAAIFLTFSPNDVGSSTLCVYAGELELESLLEMGPEQLPSSGKRFSIVARDPAAAATCYQQLVDLVHEHIIGIDCETGETLPDGGVFGYCQAFIGSDETQRRGSLHRHELIWVRGVPATVEEFERMISGKDGDKWKDE